MLTCDGASVLVACVVLHPVLLFPLLGRRLCVPPSFAILPGKGPSFAVTKLFSGLIHVLFDYASLGTISVDSHSPRAFSSAYLVLYVWPPHVVGRLFGGSRLLESSTI